MQSTLWPRSTESVVQTLQVSVSNSFRTCTLCGVNVRCGCLSDVYCCYFNNCTTPEITHKCYLLWEIIYFPSPLSDRVFYYQHLCTYTPLQLLLFSMYVYGITEHSVCQQSCTHRVTLKYRNIQEFVTR